MDQITVSKLSKTYEIYKKEQGIIGTVKSLIKRKYETVHALKSVTFSIAEGELIGFIGPNGAGKTTTLKCLSGLLYPSSGHVSVLGHIPFDRKKAFLRKISLVMGQKNQLWWDLPAFETFRLQQAIYEIDDDQFHKTICELTEQLSVDSLLSIPVRKLSLGERMKMELIAALIHKPSIVFLDEPTIGLDVVMQQKVRSFISRYNKEQKATILLTSHYMQDVSELAKRVLVIDRGEIMYDGQLANLVALYGGYKLVRFVSTVDIRKEYLSKWGEVINKQEGVVELKISKKNIVSQMPQMIKSFAIEDFTVTDPSIEDVIRDVFTKGVTNV